MTSGLVLGLAHLQKPTLRLLKTFPYGLFGLPWEIVLLDHVMMQVISQELGAGAAPMAIVDTEEGASRPRLVLSMLWLDYVEYDGHSILVIVSD